MKNKKYYVSSFLWLAFAAVIFGFDRFVKNLILSKYNKIGTVFGEIPYVADFTYVRNTGAAFSMFSDGTVFLSVVSIAFCIAVVMYWIIAKPQHKLNKTALMLIFSGALGNAVDRVFYGYVVDFISIKWFNFPVFNIADMAIVIGAILFMIYVIFFEKDKKAGENKNG